MGTLSLLFGQRKIQSLEQIFQASDVTTSEMQAAIGDWLSLYFDAAAPPEENGSLRLPVVIVNKLYKTVFSEYTASVRGDDTLGKWLCEELRLLNKTARTALQYQLIGGECLIKPVPCGEYIDFVPIRRDFFTPFGRDSQGKLTSIGLVETVTEHGRYYTLAERRTADSSGILTIESRLYQSNKYGVIGQEVPLQTLPRYAALQPELRLEGIGGIGAVQLRTPLFNCVDGSTDAVAVYAPAAELIKAINQNERQLCDEFENGASRVIASADLIKKDVYGHKRLRDKLFVGLDDDPDSVGITIFSPPLREASYLARKQEYLRNCETLIGFKRGILSEVEAAERTATEITSSAGDYNLTIQDFQAVWENALRETMELCVKLGRLYHMIGDGSFEPQKDISVDWGDGVLSDRTRTWSEYMQLVGAGMLKPELALAWYFEQPHDTPEDLARIREHYMPEMSRLTDGNET